jgi:hypothetical protein
MRRSVLVGFAEALAAPEVAASLLAAGYGVLAFKRRGRPAPLRRLRGVELIEVTPPEEDLTACAAEVAAAARGHDATMPLDDLAVFVCDRCLPDDAPLAGPRGAHARLALDKRLQLRAAEAAGFAVPAWVELAADGSFANGEGAAPGNSSRLGALAAPEDSSRPRAPAAGRAWTTDLGLPAILKPALAAEAIDGRLRRLAPRAVASIAELEAVRGAWGDSTPVIVQRWVDGVGGGVFGLADEEGVGYLSAHRRVRMMNPAGSGSSACVSTPVPEELLAPVGRLLRDACWRGMFMVEFLRSADTCWFMELNGRPWGSLALARRLGYEYPAWAIDRLLDETSALPEPPPFSELLCRHLGRELVHLLFVLRGPSAPVGTWPGRGETVRALLRGDRRHTAWYNLGPGMLGVFLEDTWRTVVDQTLAKRRLGSR